MTNNSFNMQLCNCCQTL